jgi:hypothetical protein
MPAPEPYGWTNFFMDSLNPFKDSYYVTDVPLTRNDKPLLSKTDYCPSLFANTSQAGGRLMQDVFTPRRGKLVSSPTHHMNQRSPGRVVTEKKGRRSYK